MKTFCIEAFESKYRKWGNTCKYYALQFYRGFLMQQKMFYFLIVLVWKTWPRSQVPVSLITLVCQSDHGLIPFNKIRLINLQLQSFIIPINWNLWDPTPPSLLQISPPQLSIILMWKTSEMGRCRNIPLATIRMHLLFRAGQMPIMPLGVFYPGASAFLYFSCTLPPSLVLCAGCFKCVFLQLVLTRDKNA